MRSAPIPHPWQAIQIAYGVDATEVNPLELGRPFRFTESQRAAIQPYLEAAGQGGAVLIVASHSPYDNWLHAEPIALTQSHRKSITASLTRIKKQNL